MTSTPSALPIVKSVTSGTRTAQTAMLAPAAGAEARLRRAYDRLVACYVSPDQPFLEMLTDHDFLLTDIDGAWRDRKAFLAMPSKLPPLDNASNHDVRIRLFSDIALVQSLVEAMGRNGSTFRMRSTSAFVWRGTDWRLIHVQNTLLKDKVPLQLQTLPQQAYPASPKTMLHDMVLHDDDPSRDDLSVLERLNERYVDAFRGADIGWYEAHLAADYDVVSGDGTFEDRSAALADFAIPYFANGIKSFPVGRVRVRQFGNAALIHAENAYELKDGRRGVNRYTDIWIKQDEAWQCVCAHITVRQAPGSPS